MVVSLKYIIVTLGCKVNQYETQAVETILREHGHEPCPEGETADAVIVNTCAVTAESGRKSRQAVRALMEANPGAVTAVCGCYSQLSPDTAEKLGADVVYGSGDREKLVADIENAVKSGTRTVNVDVPFERRIFEELPAGTFAGRTRALLKIQDGCANFCTYCIIPYTRGRPRSLPMADAAAQAAALAREGYRELVITGIEIASYGIDLTEKPGLADVVCAVSAAAPHMRIRLGSLEPTVITEEFCRALAGTGSVCRHFHLSLQSGCDSVLKRMNRKYDTTVFLEKTELLRKYFPGCGLTADLIVGFPGETEEEHRQSASFIETCGFSHVHIFPYSRRPGTPADKMDGQITRGEKARRAKEARAAADRAAESFLKSCVGKILPVLFETCDGDTWYGHSDTYILTGARGDSLRGLVKSVKITGIEGENLVGEIV
jgi:threonylcarbamoyladenosine tRNA methylthiotransferase MtaB